MLNCCSDVFLLSNNVLKYAARVIASYILHRSGVVKVSSGVKSSSTDLGDVQFDYFGRATFRVTREQHGDLKSFCRVNDSSAL